MSQSDVRAFVKYPEEVAKIEEIWIIKNLFFFLQRRKTLDANRYATKKTIAQGMLDVALLTANASQLKYVLQVGEEKHEFYHLMLALIILSIILQVNKRLKSVAKELRHL